MNWILGVGRSFPFEISANDVFGQTLLTASAPASGRLGKLKKASLTSTGGRVAAKIGLLVGPEGETV